MESTKLFKTNIKQTKNAKISCQSAKKMRKKETKKKQRVLFKHGTTIIFE